MRVRPGVAVLVVVLCTGCLSISANRSRPDSPTVHAGAVAHEVDDNSLRVSAGELAVVRIDRSFRYVGGQRFVLRGVADAEQHFFVHAEPNGVIRQMYWVQIESFLPDSGGAYDYAEDDRVSVHGLPFHTSTRRFTTPPVDDSDRGIAYAFLRRHGLTVPHPATRSRIVYLPGEDKRAEVMIIYVEAAVDTSDPTPEEEVESLSRLLAGLDIRTFDN